MDEQDSARFEFKMRFVRTPYIAQGPRYQKPFLIENKGSLIQHIQYHDDG